MMSENNKTFSENKILFITVLHLDIFGKPPILRQDKCKTLDMHQLAFAI